MYFPRISLVILQNILPNDCEKLLLHLVVIWDFNFYFIMSIYLYIDNTRLLGGYLRGAVANVQDCDFVVSEFKLQSCYYFHFRSNTLRKGMNFLILSPMDLFRGCPRGVMVKAMDCGIVDKRVRTPVALLRSLSRKIPMGKV